MGRTVRLLGVILIWVLLSVFARGVVELESRSGIIASSSLTYVESSGGLIPPTMDGGHTEVEMGDVNADGYLDLVSIGDHGSPYVNTDQHGVMVWFGDGAGSWSVYQNGDFGYGGVALGDANGDGLVDVGYGMHHAYSGTDFGDQLLEVALGDGTGQNWTPWDDGLVLNDDPWGMFGTDFSDVDNDGDLDVGSVSFGCCDGVHVYLNQGDGTWVQSFGFAGGNSDMLFVFGDVNGDGNADLAVSQEYGTVYLGDGAGDYVLGDGNLPPLPPYATRPGVSLGDVDHDGRDDLAFCSDSGGVEVWGWVSADTWQDLSGSLPGSGPYEATQLFDMDMDGHLDVAAFGDGQVRVWAGDGTGGWIEIAAFTTPSPGYLSAFRVGGDADHNGFPDIVVVAEEGSWPSEQNHIRFFKEASTPVDLGIKPVSPLGGETYVAGGIVFVDWISAVPSGGPGAVSLELSTHGPDGPWNPIAAGLPNGGRHQWHIPPDTVTTSEAYVRYTLVVTPGTAVALTPGPFTILGIGEEPIWGLEAINDSPTALGQTTTLTATVISGTNVIYQWVFGDGISGEGTEIAHVYPDLGAYTAAVTASNSLSLLTSTTTVTITDASVEGLIATNDSPTMLGGPTTLTATLEAGSNVTYTWALGDGTVGCGAVLTHTYPAVGPYAAMVTASNGVNALTATTAVTVTDVPIEGLVAASNSPTPLGCPTTFTATVRAGSNVTYTWDLGDGVAKAGAVVTHTYTAAAVYTCLVTASNSAGWLTATAPVTITRSGTAIYLPLVWRGPP
jgi:PKD repeat protein